MVCPFCGGCTGKKLATESKRILSSGAWNRQPKVKFERMMLLDAESCLE
jgi:hypothetical protein